MTNPFLAALLKMAAEERLHEERLRVLATSWNPEDRSPWGRSTRWAIKDCHDKADEHAGRAEVYEKFARKLISEVASDFIVAEFETLTGPVELLSVDKPVEFVYEYEGWQRNYWQFPIVIPPHPLIVNFLTN